MMRMGYEPSRDSGPVHSPSFDHEPPGLAAFRSRVEQEDARSLSKLIESEIIPRLVVAHAGPGTAAAPIGADGRIAPGEVEALAPLALQVEADHLLSHVEAVIARGVAVDTIMVDLLAPTARLLGEYWESDQCDFVEVTMGLWRLQEVIHEIANRMPTDKGGTVGANRVLFAPMPGEQHSFGTVVIDELFRRDGWVTERIGETQTPDLLRRVADEWFDMIGLTISCDCHIAPLASLIVALRNVSRNSRVCVMVGGRVFSESPELADQVGADGTAKDARLALEIAGALVRDRMQYRREIATGR